MTIGHCADFCQRNIGKVKGRRRARPVSASAITALRYRTRTSDGPQNARIDVILPSSSNVINEIGEI